MESKSPKEIQVEEKITELVTKIVDGQTSGDDLPMRLWNSLQNNQEIVAIQKMQTSLEKENIGTFADSIAANACLASS